MTDLSAYEPYIAFFRVQIEGLQERTPEGVRKIIAAAALPGLNAEISEAIAKYFETQYDIKQKRGNAVTAIDFKPWLNEERMNIDFHYWNRLRKYHTEHGTFPPRVLSVLDTVTDEILNYAGNPRLEGQWARRGMVLGHVQSGKTSNYSALICKAADAGYKVIILLTGITNSLRKQTQERIDDAFIGRRAIFSTTGIGTKIGAARYSDGPAKHPSYGTSVDQDFSRQAATSFGVSIANQIEPVIFVTKKNVSTLKNLKAWLEAFYPNGNIPYPLLLIDDEADNASINTSDDPDRLTRINESIRGILSLFSRSSYVGYTATPFANIFIDPESDGQMIKDDLFPRDYIKTLDPPDNYVGPSRVFDEDGDLREIMIEEIEDYEDILPLKHKNNHPVSTLPDSLFEAVRVFILVRAIRILRGQGRKHCTMMVNVSRFNSVQADVQGEIYTYLQTLKEAISVNAGLGKDGLKNKYIQLLKNDFDSQFSDQPYPWEDLQKALHEAADSITTRTVNMRGGALDYSQFSETGLHVIAVGGLALSRGLTLEGLCVSYILRNASAYDTLMQMGRWFGYRPGYEDLCRLYMPKTAQDYYEYISDVTEELRMEIQRMDALKLTPKDFGLRVRQHPATIRITAANKMRTAQRIRVAANFQHRHVEGHTVWNSDEKNHQNREIVSELIKKLGNPSPHQEGIKEASLFWRDVNLSTIREFIKSFNLPPVNTELGALQGTGNSSLVTDYIDDRESELSTWDVCLPEKLIGDPVLDETLIPGRTLQCRTRLSGTLLADGKMFRITGKQKAADKMDAGFGLAENVLGDEVAASDVAFNEKRKKPLLLIHVFQADTKDENSSPAFSEKCVSYSLCFPGTKLAAVEREYQANLVYQQQELSSPDADEDEDMEALYA